MQQKHIMWFDIIFYVVFPIFIWNMARDYTGDYIAMLISSVPGIIYTVYRFVLLKKVNTFGIYMIATLIIGTVLDLIAGGGLQLLWNNIYYDFVMGAFFIFTVIFMRPIWLFFTVDFMELQGGDRKQLKKQFYVRKYLWVFQAITLFFALREFILAFVKIWLVQSYGVEAFDEGIILRQVLSWTMSFIAVVGFIFIAKWLHEDGIDAGEITNTGQNDENEEKDNEAKDEAPENEREKTSDQRT